MSISSVSHIIMAACLSLLLFILVIPAVANAELLPEEILVVVNAESGDSVRIGRIYVQLRHIPPAHLLMVSLPMRDEITRGEYDDLIAAPLSGRYTLAEVFAMTNPFLSWRMVLIGDPLYNPFKARPAFLLMDAPPPPG